MSTVSYVDVGLSWRPMFDDAAQGSSPTLRLLMLLRDWEPTKYMSGQSLRGQWADCLGFTGGVWNDMRKGATEILGRIPPDAALHDPERAWGTIRTMLELFPATRIEPNVVEPGDVLVTGEPGGGPGHVMIVGTQRNMLWHCNKGTGVARTGWALAAPFQQLLAVYRSTERASW